MQKKLLLQTVGDQTESIVIDRLVIAGWVGKDRDALQKHIDELGELGIEPPGQTPTYMNMSSEILTPSTAISVVGAGSSGEVECVIISAKNGQRYIGVGSDHTDREFEKYSIPASKQMCSKPLASEMWAFSEVEDHLGSLIMKSWMTKDGVRKLYQEGTLDENLDIRDILNGIPSDCVKPGESFCLFCGTFAAIGGLAYGERFEFELCDPILKRSITHTYDVEVQPQYL